MSDKDLSPKLNSVINRVIHKSTETIKDNDDLILKIADEFLQQRLHEFPRLCNQTRIDNLLQRQQFESMGNAGGWSEKRDFKFDYTIPKELYNFMINMVDRNFWEEDNEKIWRPFLDGIMRSQDPELLLRKCKLHYDGNDKSKKILIK